METDWSGGGGDWVLFKVLARSMHVCHASQSIIGRWVLGFGFCIFNNLDGSFSFLAKLSAQDLNSAVQRPIRFF